jgi:hypothetical protein
MGGSHNAIFPLLRLRLCGEGEGGFVYDPLLGVAIAESR